MDVVCFTASLLLTSQRLNRIAGRVAFPDWKREVWQKEIGQIIGSSRETVIRTFADLRKRQIAVVKGATLVIRNKSALKQIANN